MNLCLHLCLPTDPALFEDPRSSQDIAFDELNQSAKDAEDRKKNKKKGAGATPGDEDVMTAAEVV